MVVGVPSPRLERLDTVESSSDRGTAAGRMKAIPSVNLSVIGQGRLGTYTLLKWVPVPPCHHALLVLLLGTGAFPASKVVARSEKSCLSPQGILRSVLTALSAPSSSGQHSLRPLRCAFLCSMFPVFLQPRPQLNRNATLERGFHKQSDE